MTLQIAISPEMESQLRRRAAASGKDLSAFVLEAVEEKLKAPESFTELLAPIHAATRQSGMSEDEIDALIEESRDRIYAEKQARSTA